MRRLICLLAAAMIACAVAPASGHATFKGRNGVIAIYNGSPAGTPPDDGVDPPERNVYLSTINPDGSDRTLLAADKSGFGHFSPDGAQISFQSQLPVTCCTGDTEIEVMNVDSSARHLVYSYGQLPWYRSNDDVVRWSPDGSTLLFTHHLGKYCASRVYTVPASGGA